MPRRFLLLLLAAGAFAVVAVGAGGKTPGEPTCRTSEVRVHDEAVFGHFSTRAAAKRLAARATRAQLMGVKIEDDGCGDYEVEIDGADTDKDRGSFAREAGKLGFEITFEQQAPPMAYQEGQVVGVLGRLPTLAAANALMWRLAHANFHYIDVVPQGKRWFVVMPQVPVKKALPIAREVAVAGFHIQFQQGAKT
jgi:hypothetical protein